MEVSKPEASPQKYLNAEVKTSIKKWQHNSQSKEGLGETLVIPFLLLALNGRLGMNRNMRVG